MGDVARVILLAGPSGSGKSTMARASGLPLLELDDFYRDVDDPGMPRHASLGIVDWDHPDAWNAEAAVTAILQLCRSGSARVPVYDMAADRAVDSTTMSLAGCRCFIAEGIFAPELVHRLQREGVLADAVVVQRRPWKNFVRRLFRDLKDGRKPPATLMRRGLALWHAEPGWMRHCVARRCRPLGARAARALFAGYAG